MKPRRLCLLACLGLAAMLALPGCQRQPPQLTEVEGVVLLDGKPLPQAQVEFVPELKDWGAEWNSTAITDEQGHFTLKCTLQDQPGAAVARHRVTVIEAPVAGDMRGMDERSQARLAQYQASLKNRPIPEVYGSVGRTPLIIEVKPDQKTYDLTL